MRVSLLATLPLIGALAIAPRQGSAQVNVAIHLGPPIMVTDYSPEYYGDWRTRYESWRPVTVYSYDGRWYPTSVRGSHRVIVYRSQNHYFLPPRDAEWNNRDQRYNYTRRPNDDDYKHVGPPAWSNGRGRGHAKAAKNGHGRGRPGGGN